MNLIGIVACLSFPLALAGAEVSRRWFASRASGWRELRRRYPGEASMAGRAARRGAVRVNGRRYDPPPTVTLTRAGLHLRMDALVTRACHAPLLVPWDDVTAVLDDAEGQGELPLRVGDSAVITLAGPVAGEVARALARLRARPARRPRR